MNWTIRKSKKEDCKAIAHVVTISWNETYVGIVNDKFLNNMFDTEETRYKNAYNNFKDAENHQFVLEINGIIEGFTKVIVLQDREYENCGEIQALYIMKEYKDMGFGKKLFDTAIQEIKNMGFNKMIVGCIQENRSNGFYKKMGGELIKEREFNLPNQKLIENVYLFDNL